MGKMRNFRRALRSSVGGALAYQLRDGFGASLAPLLEGVIRGNKVHDADIAEAIAPDDEDEIRRVQAGPQIIPATKAGGKAIALVPVRGIALYDVEFQPYAFSTLLLAQTVNGLASDPSIGTIVLDIDSPGGAVTGTAEAADAIFAAREKVNVVALINPLAASAAYWIASQASEIVAVPSADVGSIGVFMMHADCSGLMEQMGVDPTFVFAGKFKIEGNRFEPLSEEGREHYQGEVDTIYRAFTGAVARGRGVSVEDVVAKFGEGRTVMAPEAKRLGMIDRVATLDVAFGRFGLTMGAAADRRRIEDPATAEGPPESEPAETPETSPETEPEPAESVTACADGSAAEAAQRRRRLALLRA